MLRATHFAREGFARVVRLPAAKRRAGVFDFRGGPVRRAFVRGAAGLRVCGLRAASGSRRPWPSWGGMSASSTSSGRADGAEGPSRPTCIRSVGAARRAGADVVDRCARGGRGGPGREANGGAPGPVVVSMRRLPRSRRRSVRDRGGPIPFFGRPHPGRPFASLYDLCAGRDHDRDSYAGPQADMGRRFGRSRSDGLTWDLLIPTDCLARTARGSPVAAARIAEGDRGALGIAPRACFALFLAVWERRTRPA